MSIVGILRAGSYLDVPVHVHPMFPVTFSPGPRLATRRAAPHGVARQRDDNEITWHIYGGAERHPLPCLVLGSRRRTADSTAHATIALRKRRQGQRIVPYVGKLQATSRSCSRRREPRKSGSMLNSTAAQQMQTK